MQIGSCWFAKGFAIGECHCCHSHKCWRMTEGRQQACRGGRMFNRKVPDMVKQTGALGSTGCPTRFTTLPCQTNRARCYRQSILTPWPPLRKISKHKKWQGGTRKGTTEGSKTPQVLEGALFRCSSGVHGALRTCIKEVGTVLSVFKADKTPTLPSCPPNAPNPEAQAHAGHITLLPMCDQLGYTYTMYNWLLRDTGEHLTLHWIMHKL